jgi:hypothetical protein
MTQPDWNDERLDAAFHERFDRSAPAGLEKGVHVRIVGTSPARFGGWHVGRAWPLGAAIVVILVAGVAMVGLGGLGRTGGSAIPSDAGVSASAEAQATPTEQALPPIIFDLPVIDVSDAITIRDAGVDDREIAVMGWFRPAPLISCPFTPTVNPLQFQCPDTMMWLTRDFDTHSFDPPVGPGLNPDLNGIDTSWVPAPQSGGVNNDLVPVDVVFVGHFDDRRATLCPEAEVAACRDRFVVDSVARVHGVEPPLSVTGVTAGSTKSSLADIEAIIANEAPQSPILSMAAVDAPGDLATIEPSLKVTGDSLLVQSIVWAVRVLETDRISTYLVVDGTDRIYEMNPDNHAVQVGGTVPGASPTPTDQAISGSVFGLEIMHVSDALAIRDAGVDDRELAVQGWFTPSLAPSLRCAAPRYPQTSPVQEQCGDSSVWLTRDGESLIHRSGNETTISDPEGPALRPYLDNLDLSWQPSDFGIGANGDSSPTDVVFIGHFDDRRAALCPEADISACRDRFVVDSVARVHGVEPPLSVSRQNTGSATSTVEDIKATLADDVPRLSILWMAVVDGQTGLERIEPSLANVIGGRFLEPVLWVVRVLESGRISTYIVVDGSRTIYEMNTAGDAIQAGGAAPSPS